MVLSEYHSGHAQGGRRAAVQTAWNDSVPHLINGAVEEFIATAESLSGVDVRQDSTVYFDNAYLDE